LQLDVPGSLLLCAVNHSEPLRIVKLALNIAVHCIHFKHESKYSKCTAHIDTSCSHVVYMRKARRYAVMATHHCALAKDVLQCHRRGQFVKSLAWIVCMKRFKIYVQSDFRTKAIPFREEKLVSCRGHTGLGVRG
jgi:hypothetical protein